MAANYRRLYRRLRTELIQHYGGKCVSCGETDIDVLELDHIDGTGGVHRRAEPSAKKMASWAKARGYPPGFQVLCGNCHARKTNRA